MNTGFLTAVLQNHARKYNIPIDTLSFAYEIIDTPHQEINNPPVDGAYVYGLYIEGGRWSKDERVLDDPLPGEMHSVSSLAVHVNPF